MKQQLTLLPKQMQLCFLLLFFSAVVASAQTAVFSGVGNSELGAPYTPIRDQNTGGLGWSRFVSGNMDDLFVTSNGYAYSCTVYEENHQALSRYWDKADGSKRGNVEIVGPRDWATGNAAIAVNASYIYSNYYNSGTGVNTIRSYNLSNFSDANSVNVMTSTSGSGTTAQIFGIACGNNEVYVSDHHNNKIKVYNNTLGFIREFNFTRPRKICVASDGNLWIIQGGTGDNIKDSKSGSRVIKVSKDNGAVLDQITDVLKPMDIEKSHANTNILVGDADASRCHIRVYNTSGDLVSTVGERVGASIPHGAKPNQFDFITGVGQDASGKYYVSFHTIHNDTGGSTLRCLDGSNNLVWEAFSNPFIDCADIDPGNENTVYTSVRKFNMDWTKGVGKEQSVAGLTIDRYAYPEDKRLSRDLISFSQAVRIGGKLFTVVSDQWCASYGIYRKDPDGEIMIPALLWTREATQTGSPGGTYIWTDGTGGQPFDGKPQAGEYQSLTGLPGSFQWLWIDKNGNAWMGFDHLSDNTPQSKFRRYACTGLNANGIPVYSATNYTEYTCPDFWKVNQVQYDAAEDDLYISGYYSTDSPKYWRAPGAHIKRYDDFLASPHFNEAATIDFPGQSHSNGAVICWSATKPYVFLGQRRSADNYANVIYVYNSGTGAQVGSRLTMPNTVGGLNGKEFYGTGFDAPHGLRSFKRASGMIEILAEDVSYQKAFVIHYCPSGTCSGTVTQAPYGGSARPIPGTIQAEDYDTGGQGVAYNDTETANQGGQYRTSEGVDVQTRTGGGYNVGWMNTGEWLEYTVNVTAGTYNIGFDVASGSSTSSLKLLLDGVDLGTVTTTNTGGWQVWKTASLTGKTLSGGTSKILRVEVVQGGINLDKLTFTSTGTTPVNNIYEAEASGNTLADGAQLQPAKVNWMGSVQFNSISVPSAGSYTLTISYLNGSGGNRNLDVIANGANTGSVACPATANWETVGTITKTITLNAGTNTIKLYGNPGPDVDKIRVSNSAARLSTVSKGEISSDLMLYPNPASGRVTLHLTAIDAQNVQVQIVDLQGRRLLTQQQAVQAGNNELSVPLKHLSKGLYLIQTTLDGKLHTHRLIVIVE